MSIAIQKSKSPFTKQWVIYCKEQGIPFKLVDCYSNNLAEQLSNCHALIWHHHHGNPKDILAAKPILFALEQAGVKVFPDFKTNWHFDDKLGQKYLLEAIKAPLVPTYIFYTKQDAIEWAKEASWPKVFKLRGGAGSQNVHLVDNRNRANRIIKKAFGRGFSAYNASGRLKESLRKFREGKGSIIDLAKGLIRFAIPPPYSRIGGREKGYVYFQDFIPGNDHDIRMVVIGDKAFAIKRMVRINDFRASGGGHILYDKDLFNVDDIRLAFDIHKKLNSQCTAMDFVHDKGITKLIEISYGFSPEGYNACPGYWDHDLNWHQGPFNPYGWMIENLE